MPRKRPLIEQTKNSINMLSREVFEARGIDPLVQLINMATETVEVGALGERIFLMDKMMGYEKGMEWRARIWLALNEFVRPKLRAVETKNRNENTYHIEIKQFGRTGLEPPKTVTIEAPPVEIVQKVIDEDRAAVEVRPKEIPGTGVEILSEQ